MQEVPLVMRCGISYRSFVQRLVMRKFYALESANFAWVGMKGGR